MLTWGNTSAIIATLEKMVRREGLGNVLADGVQRAAERIGKGAEKYSVHIRSQEPDLHDPRFSPCRSLAYVADPTPGRHMTASASMRLDGEKKLASCPELQAPEGVSEYERMGRERGLGVSYRQAFNVREGLAANDFKLPIRIAGTPPDGRLAGRNIDFGELRAN